MTNFPISNFFFFICLVYVLSIIIPTLIDFFGIICTRIINWIYVEPTTNERKFSVYRRARFFIGNEIYISIDLHATQVDYTH